jgi:hypothetical protein
MAMTDTQPRPTTTDAGAPAESGEYSLTNVDKDLGDKVESGVRAKQDEKDPKAGAQGNPARSSMQARA